MIFTFYFFFPFVFVVFRWLISCGGLIVVNIKRILALPDDDVGKRIRLRVDNHAHRNGNVTSKLLLPFGRMTVERMKLYSSFDTPAFGKLWLGRAAAYIP
jgi:hypothetical protein